MAEPRFADEDDLPRTFRREREARERELRERERETPTESARGNSGGGAPGFAASEPYHGEAYGYDYAGPPPGTVTRFDVPFGHLVAFFIKAAFAAIPALLLLTLLFWGIGQGLKNYLPGLRHFEVVIRTPH
ncbi:MAG: hypothetical protein JSS20_06150 [Proteobacteria bacterium]|nr:hypothetical protein [Pseudomonadota bacterium]